MPTPTKGPRLGGSPAHERLMLANLATSLFEHGRITTTETKAKRLRPLAEKLVTFAKRGDLHARRQVMTTIRDKDVVHTLFAEIGPRYENRPGGYTRITKVGPRKGDNAPMAVIELVEALTVGQQAVGEAERARGTRFASGAGAAAAAGEVTADAVETADDVRRGAGDRHRRLRARRRAPGRRRRHPGADRRERRRRRGRQRLAGAGRRRRRRDQRRRARRRRHRGRRRPRRRGRARPRSNEPTLDQPARPGRARHRHRWRARPSSSGDLLRRHGAARLGAPARSAHGAGRPGAGAGHGAAAPTST